jgi:hypothetical protein
MLNPIMLNCELQPTNLEPGIITHGVIPIGGGTIQQNVHPFILGEHIIFKAVPFSGRVFIKWLGTSVSYNPVAEFDVTTKDREEEL